MGTKVNLQPQMEKKGLGIIYRTPSSSEAGVMHYTFYSCTDDEWMCTCKGWQYSQHCWHLEQAKKKLRESRDARGTPVPEVDDG